MQDRRVRERRAVYAPSSGVLSFMAGLVVGIAMAWTFAAFAEDLVDNPVTLRWQDPVSTVDGTPLEPGQLSDLYLYRTTSAGPERVMRFDPGVGFWEGSLALPPGRYCFHMTAAVGADESQASNEVCGTWEVGGGGGGVVGTFHIPQPPAGFTMTIG